MSHKIRIKDIAEKAGVSPGTVDRVLHNRGNVSPLARKAVEKVLTQVDYRPNIHISALSLRKKYNIIITIPRVNGGDYWGIAQKGIQRAVDEYDNVKINCRFCYYDQFDIYSCQNTFEEVIAAKPDAVIIGPTFKNETIRLTNSLKDWNIPYTYIDSMVEGTSPVAFFSCDHYKCGYLAAKLISLITPDESGIVLFQAVRIGDTSANVTTLRKTGFMDFFQKEGICNKVIRMPFSVMEPERNNELIGDFFETHPHVKGAVVLSSRGMVIANYIRSRGLRDIKLLCIDLTEANIKEVKAGGIEFVIGQRPEQQGFMAMKALIQFLIYGSVGKRENYMPLDIIRQENIDFYTEFNDMIDS